MKSKNYEKFKRFYDNGLWNLQMLKNVVGKKYGITVAEFEEITGEKYIG